MTNLGAPQSPQPPAPVPLCSACFQVSASGFPEVRIVTLRFARLYRSRRRTKAPATAAGRGEREPARPPPSPGLITTTEHLSSSSLLLERPGPNSRAFRRLCIRLPRHDTRQTRGRYTSPAAHEQYMNNGVAYRAGPLPLGNPAYSGERDRDSASARYAVSPEPDGDRRSEVTTRRSSWRAKRTNRPSTGT